MKRVPRTKVLTWVEVRKIIWFECFPRCYVKPMPSQISKPPNHNLPSILFTLSLSFFTYFCVVWTQMSASGSRQGSSLRMVFRPIPIDYPVCPLMGADISRLGLKHAQQLFWCIDCFSTNWHCCKAISLAMASKKLW